MTPREFAAVLEGQQRRELRRFTADVAAEYYGASFARSKKLPNLERLLRRISGKTVHAEQQTPEEMLAVIESWNRLLGGEDHTADLKEQE